MGDALLRALDTEDFAFPAECLASTAIPRLTALYAGDVEPDGART
jgi:hypothetical protein